MPNSNQSNAHRAIDLRSDTFTRPTPAMRKAMAEAIVGDDVWGEDPTINELESRCAKLFGKEAALFVPTGTMANLLAVMVHCTRRGSEAIAGHLTHIYAHEQGNAANLAGVQITPIKNKPDGTFCLKELRKKIRGSDCHEPVTEMVAVENTHNTCSGVVLSLEFLEEVSKICKEYGLRSHMDGARIFNAAEFLQVPVSRITRDFDSVCFCISKGLSAPVGSILIGSNKFIAEARRLRKGIGGGMRQVGVLAAAGLVALDTIVPILKHDHRRARKIAEDINNLNSDLVKINMSRIQTNIIIINMIKPDQFSGNFLQNRLEEVKEYELSNGVCDENGRGIIINCCSIDYDLLRIVLYHEITDDDVELVIRKFTFCIREMEGNKNGLNRKLEK